MHELIYKNNNSNSSNDSNKLTLMQSKINLWWAEMKKHGVWASGPILTRGLGKFSQKWLFLNYIFEDNCEHDGE